VLATKSFGGGRNSGFGGEGFLGLSVSRRCFRLGRPFGREIMTSTRQIEDKKRQKKRRNGERKKDT
jgi:hypothetical protein